MNRIRDDFDRIALLTERHGDAGSVYHDYLIRHLPPHPEYILEIGCGTGEFTRLLSSRARRVVALDLSPQMIRLAKSQSESFRNIEYLTADVMQHSLAAGEYDCIVSIAALHHLPREQALMKMKNALKPNGVLIIHDIVADDGIVDGSMSVLAWLVSTIRRFRKTGRMRTAREVREAWAEHGRDEVYMTLPEIREMCRKYLPGARIRRHLLWRYTVVWHKHGEA